jgi:hypothetical protein
MRKSSVTGRFWITTIVALALPAFALAQHHGGGMGAAPAGRSATIISRAGSAPARVAVRSGVQSARIGTPAMRNRTPGRVFHNGNHANSAFNGLDTQNVPGLGFDYPHLAAVTGNRRLHGGRFNGGFPFGFGGFLLGSPGIIEETPTGDSGAVADEIAGDPTSEDGPDPAAAPRRSRIARAPVQPETELGPVAPPRDVEQYVLVRQDGGLVFAVAYTWENGTLRYITPDGLRRSIGRDALDLNATQQFNEQRGLDFRLPA